MEFFGNNALSVDVGARLKSLREERNISIRALARSSGLSANALSMIERGLTSPSVSTLNKVAAALEIPVAAFFRLEPEKQKVVFRKAGERTRIPFTRGLWEGLGGESFAGRMEAFLMTVENGGSSGPHGLLHSGHEFVFCLRGQLEYTVDNDRYLLDPGDALIFAARMIHRWRNPGPNVVNAIIVISSFEENERPSEYHLVSRESGTTLDQLDDEGLEG